jgi:hypothetical protein
VALEPGLDLHDWETRWQQLSWDAFEDVLAQLDSEYADLLA